MKLTGAHIAPELQNARSAMAFNPAADIYSFGVLCQQLKRKCSLVDRPRKELGTAQFISSCCHHEPSRRLTAQQALDYLNQLKSQCDASKSPELAIPTNRSSSAIVRLWFELWDFCLSAILFLQKIISSSDVIELDQNIPEAGLGKVRMAQVRYSSMQPNLHWIPLADWHFVQINGMCVAIKTFPTEHLKDFTSEIKLLKCVNLSLRST